jgi:hypothetical protein
LPSARARALGKDFLKKKFFAECHSEWALGKEITKKIYERNYASFGV